MSNNKRKATIQYDRKEKKRKQEKVNTDFNKILLLNTPGERAALDFVSVFRNGIDDDIYRVVKNGWLYYDEGIITKIATKLESDRKSSFLHKALRDKSQYDEKNNYISDALHVLTLVSMFKLDTVERRRAYTKEIKRIFKNNSNDISKYFTKKLTAEREVTVQEKANKFIIESGDSKWFKNLEKVMERNVNESMEEENGFHFFTDTHWLFQAQQMALSAITDFLAILNNEEGEYLKHVTSNCETEEYGISFVNRLLLLSSYGTRSNTIVNYNWCTDARLWPSLIQMKVPMALFISKVVKYDGNKLTGLDEVISFRKKTRAFWAPIDRCLSRKGLCINLLEKVYSYISGEPAYRLNTAMKESTLVSSFWPGTERILEVMLFTPDTTQIICSYLGLDKIVENVIV
jgi:hypothetical protein